MPRREISNLDLKVKLTKEYLENDGYKKIPDLDLLEDLQQVKVSINGKADHNTVTSRVNAFMLAILSSQLIPPYYSPSHISEYETTLQKSIYFDQINIDTAEQFDMLYQEYKDKAGFLFRGQREAKWRLYGKLQRQWIIDKLSDKFGNYQALIENLVEDGRGQYNKRYLELLGEAHDDSDNDIAVLSFLQHHGCPTPLLDWTYKFENSLFFALDGLEHSNRNREIDDYFSVYFVNEESFENGGIRNLMYESIESIQEAALNKLIKTFAKNEKDEIKMQEHFKGRKAIDITKIKGSGMIAYILRIRNMINLSATYFGDTKPDNITFSLNNSDNIKNQAGAFTWNADPTKPLEVIVSEQNIEIQNENKLDAEAVHHVLCECFNFNKKLENYIRQVLIRDGITSERIYPTPELNTWTIYEKCTK